MSPGKATSRRMVWHLAICRECSRPNTILTRARMIFAQRFTFVRFPEPHLTRSCTPFNQQRSPPRFLTAAACGSLKPPPTGRLRRAYLHLPYSMTLSHRPDTMAYITASVDQELLLRNECLAAENRILRAKRNRRLRFSDAEQATAAKLASDEAVGH